MHRSSYVFVAASAITTIVIATSSCSPTTKAQPGPAVTDGAAPPIVEPPTTTGWTTATECGQCLTTHCTSERAFCETEPSCAAHVRCADQCAVTAEINSAGRVDTQCLAACPLGENKVAERGRADYDACITTAGSFECVTCGKIIPNLFNQKCGPPAPDPNKCFECEEQYCCETYQACSNEPDCKEKTRNCLQGCDTPSCRSSCFEKFPKAVALWGRRETCIFISCATECGAERNACEDCTTRGACREPFARCGSDEGCFLVRSCVTECLVADSSCIDACVAKLPARVSAKVAKDLFVEWSVCGAISCLECR